MKWTERWIARAQRKADLRAERFRRHEEGVRTGTEPLSFMERAEAWNPFVPRSMRTADQARPGQRLNRREAVPRPDASLRLATAWLTWVRNGPICGPDGIEVAIWIRYAGQDLPFRHPPDDQAQPELPAGPGEYTVCLRRMPAGPVQSIRSFAFEANARWYAVGLARQVRQAGLKELRPARIPAGPPPASGLEEIMGEAIVGAAGGMVHGVLWLPLQARARWRQIRTGRLPVVARGASPRDGRRK